MKVSELIERLEDWKNEYGDLEVMYEDTEYGLQDIHEVSYADKSTPYTLYKKDLESLPAIIIY